MHDVVHEQNVRNGEVKVAICCSLIIEAKIGILWRQVKFDQKRVAKKVKYVDDYPWYGCKSKNTQLSFEWLNKVSIDWRIFTCTFSPNQKQKKQTHKAITNNQNILSTTINNYYTKESISTTSNSKPPNKSTLGNKMIKARIQKYPFPILYILLIRSSLSKL